MPTAPQYPDHWEADVLLSDGRTAHIRPIRPDDAERLVDFYARVSDESKYYRFFAPYPELTDADVERFTVVDHVDRVAMVVLAGEDMIAVGRFDRLDATSAEVAFLVEDAHQRRGLGSVLLEHLAQAGRDRGLRGFVAEVLPANRAMTRVFRDAGYRASQRMQDGVVTVHLSLTPTDTSQAVMDAREHRAEARSVQALLRPASVAVIGASRRDGTVGAALLEHLSASGFAGPIFAVHPEVSQLRGVPAFPRLADVPVPVALALVAVPADAVDAVVADAAAAGVRSLVVVSGGFADADTVDGRARQRRMVRSAHRHGMRVVGPHSLGIVNTALSLNASLLPSLPPPGRVGVFAQSGALGRALLAEAAVRGIGVSTAVVAGNRADVSGNDLLQYWDDDADTDVIVMSLESIGNPRKFSKLSRRIARRTPIAIVATGHGSGLPSGFPSGPNSRALSGRSAAKRRGRGPAGHLVPDDALPQVAFDSILRQSGVLRARSTSELLDLVVLLDRQSLPRGPRVSVLGNSDALGLVAAHTASGSVLVLAGSPRDLGADAGPQAFADATTQALTADGADAADAVLVVYSPPVDVDATAAVIAAVAASAESGPEGKPVLATVPLTRADALRPSLTVGPLPVFDTPEQAVVALAHAYALVRWRADVAMDGVSPLPADVDLVAAAALAQAAVADAPAGKGPHTVTAEVTAALLASVGIDVLPTRRVDSVEEAVAAGEGLGWGVVLKATAEHLRMRLDLSDVWRHIDGPEQMHRAWRALEVTMAPATEACFVVQPMAPAGVPVVVAAVEDPSYGPVVSFGVSGLTTQLLGDRSYRMAPLSVADASAMVDEIAAAALLQGYGGAEPVDVPAVVRLLQRVGLLVDALPQIASLRLDPILVATSGLSVVNATVAVARPATRAGRYTRRL